MGSIIVDTSIWIDYFRGIQNSQTKLVTELLVSTNRVAILPIILQETLQGIRDDSQFVRTQKNMLPAYCSGSML
jgi:predicted nucleic acid-binding protein